jgi:alpha-galactosidase
MGWNSWNVHHCNITADKIKAAADSIVELGLDKLGYTYVNLDDCWQHPNRDKDGHLQADPKKFPDGIKAVADYVHDKGLKFGIYSSAGTKTCQGFPGSLNYESIDAMDFAEWGVDYLKYDNCFNAGVSAKQRYGAMSEALMSTGRPIFYSICNWGNEGVAEWGNTMANSWRTTQDIEIYKTHHNQWQSIKANFIKNQMSASNANPGHWNDPDMLQVGNDVLTEEEEKTHFSLWAFAKAPLLLGNDLTNMTNSTQALVMNENLIKISQDGYGKQVTCTQGCDY